MPQDAFHIRRLTQELNAILTGGKINRVSQVNKDELTFIIYTKKTIVKLIVSTNATFARVCLAREEKEPAAVAPNFCMLLRKHLQGAEILSVKQHEFERIVEITLLCTGDFSQSVRVLRCEIMGKYSNVILTENDVVLGALKTTALVDDTHRILFAGAKYVYPAPQDKISPFDGAGMRRIVSAFEQMHPEGWETEAFARYIFENVSGLALSTAREIVARADKVKMPLWAFIDEFCLHEPTNACVQYVNGEPADFFAFPVRGGKQMESLHQAEDEYYYHKEYKKLFAEQKKKLESGARSLKKKSAKRLQDILERLHDAEKAEDNRIKGELLTANLYKIERGQKCVELDNWYDEQGGTIKIALDPLLSPAKNAQKYFKTYNKQKRAKEILLPMQQTEEREIAYADSVLSAIAVADETADLKEIEQELIDAGLLRAPKQKMGKRKAEEEVAFRQFEHNGMKILLGRNNVQNDKLLRLAGPDDIWLHTQKYHSSHAIIFTDGRQVCDETLVFAAQVCAYYSSGRDADKIPVDYCKRKFVKKPPKSRAGFVIYTDYKTVLVKPTL